MKFLIFFLFICSPVALASSQEWRVQSGTLKYSLKHMLHTTEGTTKEVKGLGKCEVSSCAFLVAAPVKSFDSGNSNRDSNMQQFTKAALFPVAEVRASAPLQEGKKNVEAEVKLAGKTHTYSIQLDLEKAGKGFRVRSGIPLKLSDFDIERPSLLGVKVEDEVPVTVDLQIAPQ